MSDRDEEFRQFMRDRASLLHQSAYLLCGDWHLAHDLVQDTLVKAYQHWPRVRQADRPGAYVRRILLNEARGRWRRRERTTVSRFPEGREPVAPDATDEFARRAGVLQHRTPCRCGSGPRSSSATWRDERARDRRRARLQRRHRAEPERPGARHPQELSRQNGVSAVNSPQETQLGRELRQLVSDQPFTPDIEAIGLRARQRHRRGLALRGATAAGAAAWPLAACSPRSTARAAPWRALPLALPLPGRPQ